MRMPDHVDDYTGQRYDLKGSTLGRVASEEERLNPTVVYKDIDVLLHQTKFKVGSARKTALETQVRSHCSFMHVSIIRMHACMVTTVKGALRAGRAEAGGRHPGPHVCMHALGHVALLPFDNQCLPGSRGLLLVTVPVTIHVCVLLLAYL